MGTASGARSGPRAIGAPERRSGSGAVSGPVVDRVAGPTGAVAFDPKRRSAPGPGGRAPVKGRTARRSSSPGVSGTSPGRPVPLAGPDPPRRPRSNLLGVTGGRLVWASPEARW